MCMNTHVYSLSTVNLYGSAFLPFGVLPPKSFAAMVDLSIADACISIVDVPPVKDVLGGLATHQKQSTLSVKRHSITKLIRLRHMWHYRRSTRFFMYLL